MATWLFMLIRKKNFFSNRSTALNLTDKKFEKLETGTPTRRDMLFVS